MIALQGRCAVLLRPNPMARSALFCFPHAGGGAAAFRSWPPALPPSVDVFAIRLPGRESRFMEAPAESMAQVVEEAVHAVRPLLGRPFLFFGHSMGAVAAYETAVALRARGLASPAHLVLAAKEPPWCPRNGRGLTGLENEGFLEAVHERYGGIAPEVLVDPELRQVVQRTLRADMQLLEEHRRDTPVVLDCPVTVLGGRADSSVTPEELEAWRRATRSEFSLRQLEGGHFFLREREEAVISLLGGVLAGLNGGSA